MFVDMVIEHFRPAVHLVRPPVQRGIRFERFGFKVEGWLLRVKLQNDGPQRMLCYNFLHGVRFKDPNHSDNKNHPRRGRMRQEGLGKPDHGAMRTFQGQIKTFLGQNRINQG